MASMKQAADELLGLLQRSEIALDGVARKLDTEFADRFSSAGVNPLALAQRVYKLQGEIPHLRAECQALIQHKQHLVDTARQLLMSNRSTLESLCSRSSLSHSDHSGVLEGFNKATAEWDAQAAVHKSELLDSTPHLTRGELNQALAGSMLAHG